MTTRIACVAIRDSRPGHEQEVYSVPPPGRHHHVIALMVQAGCPKPIKGGPYQGFLTDKGLFVSRKEAAAIALQSQQITHLKCPPNLFSEDLW